MEYFIIAALWVFGLLCIFRFIRAVIYVVDDLIRTYRRLKKEGYFNDYWYY